MKKLFKNIFLSLLGSLILSFGLYNIHSISQITEGGILGLTLFLQYWFSISPALSGFLLNFACYILGFKILGRSFIFYSCICGGSFSIFYAILEHTPLVYPNISNYPLLAAILGAVFVGIGIGLCVRVGGAPGGDDALAMTLSKLTKKEIQWIYLISDMIVLFLSLSYIPLSKIIYSFITVVLSGQIIGLFSKE